MVEAGGVGILSPLIPRNLLIILNGRNYKNSEFAKVRYTAGTPDFGERGDKSNWKRHISQEPVSGQ
jgi:hypothetical protein